MNDEFYELETLATDSSAEKPATPWYQPFLRLLRDGR